MARAASSPFQQPTAGLGSGTAAPAPNLAWGPGTPADVDATARTRERLLDAAEQAFADGGFDGASLRLITERAGANLAAVNYHFRSKEALYQEVFLRRIRPMNLERLRRLDALERIQAEGGPAPALGALLDVLLRPIVELATSRPGQPHPFARVMSRVLIEPQPFMREMMERELGPIIQRVAPLLRQVLPPLDPATFALRLQFVFGATNMTFAAVPFLPALHGALTPPAEPARQLQHLLLLAEAVLRAPLPGGNAPAADSSLPPAPSGA